MTLRNIKSKHDLPPTFGQTEYRTKRHVLVERKGLYLRKDGSIVKLKDANQKQIMSYINSCLTDQQHLTANILRSYL